LRITGVEIIRDKEVWALATVVFSKYGPDAAQLARKRALSAHRLGDDLGDRIWRQVEEAVLELVRCPDGYERLN